MPKLHDRIKQSCDRYIDRAIEEGHLEKSLHFCLARRQFYRQILGPDDLTPMDKRECILQIRKLTYTIDKMEELLNLSL